MQFQSTVQARKLTPLINQHGLAEWSRRVQGRRPANRLRSPPKEQMRRLAAQAQRALARSGRPTSGGLGSSGVKRLHSNEIRT